jgi:hypothetical protein
MVPREIETCTVALMRKAAKAAAARTAILKVAAGLIFRILESREK